MNERVAFHKMPFGLLSIIDGSEVAFLTQIHETEGVQITQYLELANYL